MCGEVGIKDLCFVANKVTCPADETFIRQALPEGDLLGCIPFAESIRQADRSGTAVLDACPGAVRACFEEVLRRLEER